MFLSFKSFPLSTVETNCCQLFEERELPLFIYMFVCLFCSALFLLFSSVDCSADGLHRRRKYYRGEEDGPKRNEDALDVVLLGGMEEARALRPTARESCSDNDSEDFSEGEGEQLSPVEANHDRLKEPTELRNSVAVEAVDGIEEDVPQSSAIEGIDVNEEQYQIGEKTQESKKMYFRAVIAFSSSRFSCFFYVFLLHFLAAFPFLPSGFFSIFSLLLILFFF